MSESSLATYVHYSPNCTKPRQGTIQGVAIHCTAGGRNLPARSFADMNRFAVKQKNGASCHYVVGGDGSIAQVCREENRAWCTSNPIDHQIITIEVASDADGDCKCNLAALNSLIKLLVDICQRNNIPRLLWRGDKALMGKWDEQNMVVHRWTANKACPGDYLYGKHAAIAQAVNERLGAEMEDDMDIKKIIEQLTPEMCYAIVAEAMAYADNLPEPEWSKKEGDFLNLKHRGIMDGTGPERFVKRDELAAVLCRMELIQTTEV